MLPGAAGRLISEEARLEPAQRHPGIRDARPCFQIRGRPEGRRKRPAKPAVFLEGAKSEHEPQGVLPLERSVDEALQPFQIPGIGIPDVVRRRPVHPVQQIAAGTQDALPVAPGEGGGQEARDGAVVRIVESMGNPQRIILDEVRLLEPVGRLVEPFTPLRQPGGRGSATKRRGGLWHRGRRMGGFGAKFAFPMQFVHPEVLWALSALTLPVLVHLFSFRRHRKVQFSQTAFLREVRQESRSRNRIRHWLVLLMRLLALACIILAFAEPVREASAGAANSGAKSVSVYLDTSPSMQLEGANGPLLAASQSGALALVESHSPTDRFHIFTSAFEPEDRRFRSREEALERIAAIRPGHAAPPIGDVLRHQQDVLAEGGAGRTEAYLFTDLQASSHRLASSTAALVDSSLSVRFVTQPVQPRVNVRVDSAWFDTPMRLTGRSEALHVRITHDAERPVDDLPLSLDLNGRRAAIGSFSLRPGLVTDTVLRFRHEASGPVHAVVQTDDAPVTFDDDLHLGYTVADRVRIVLVQGRDAGAGEQVALQRLFGDAALHEVVTMAGEALDYDALTSGDLLVLQGIRNPSSGLISALLRETAAGKSTFLIPPAEGLGPGWEELLIGLGSTGPGEWIALEEPARLGILHHEHPLFDGVFSRRPERVDLPSARGWHSRTKPGPRERRLLSFSDGRPFLTAGLHERGRFYWAAAPLAAEWTNLAQHALLVPMALRMAETARSSGIQQFHSGEDQDLLLPATSSTPDGLSLQRTEGGDTELLSALATPGGIRASLPLRDAAPGSYDILHRDGDTTRVVMAIGVNPVRAESQLETFDPEDWRQALVTAGWRKAEVLSADVQDVVAAIEVLEDGQPLWFGLIALALLFLLIEMMLLKRKSAAPPPSGTG